VTVASRCLLTLIVRRAGCRLTLASEYQLQVCRRFCRWIKRSTRSHRSSALQSRGTESRPADRRCGRISSRGPLGTTNPGYGNSITAAVAVIQHTTAVLTAQLHCHVGERRRTLEADAAWPAKRLAKNKAASTGGASFTSQRPSRSDHACCRAQRIRTTSLVIQTGQPCPSYAGNASKPSSWLGNVAQCASARLSPSASAQSR